MCLGAIIITIVSCVATVANEVDAEQFNRLITALHAPYKDVSLIVEGKQTYVGPASAVPRKAEEYEEVYQTLLVLRSDNACFQDVFVRSVNGDGLLVRKTSALLKGSLNSLRRVPDLNDERRSSKPGKASELFDTGSPCRILFLWFFNSLEDARRYDYRFVAWEQISGHNCLCVRLSLSLIVPDTARSDVDPESGYRHVFWIDMERGGNVLKYEFKKDGKLRQRVDEIELGSFPASSGERLWLPVGGEYNTFSNGRDFFDKPFFRETYHVLKNSVLVNRGLGDEQFTVDSKWTNPDETDEMRAIRQKKIALAPLPKNARIEPIDLSKRLEVALEQADGQAKRLDASTPQGAWEWVPILQTLGIVIAVGFLAVAAWNKWRAS